ncbi:MAG: metallophosphoesterase, partial [Treponema sp.]|nr:metallophosphoesterase [Treponema sp.]
MNKRIVLIIMVLLGIVLTGCPNLAGEDSGGSQISGDFIKAPGLIFSTGEKEGEIQYSWTTASPAGGVNYILYIAAGSKTRAREIQSEGKAENTGISTGSGVFTGVEGEMYSAVVMAVKGTSRAYSAVAQAKAKSFYFTGNPDPSSLYDLRFGVISDTHIGATTRGNTAYPNIQRFNKVLKWYSTQPNVKALAIVGDITDTGVQTQWDTVKNSLEANMGNLKLIAVMGNHDAYPSDKNAAANAFEGATGQKTNAHYVVDG